jgi:hypothetical protein
MSPFRDHSFARVFQGTIQQNQTISGNCGDRAVMRGTLQVQTIALENGETTSINHLYVTAIEVITRSKRTSITAYEKEKTR